MARPIRILASCRTQPTLEAVQQAVDEMPGVRLEAYNGALADVLKGLEPRRGIDMMLMDVDLANESELEVLTEVIGRAPPGIPIIATSSSSSIDRVRLLMRMGLADFVPQPIGRDDLVNSIMVARRQAVRQGTPRSTGRIIAFMRAAGGMGATTLVAQSACILAQSKPSQPHVCLIDLDIQAQAAGLYLNVDSPLSLVDCLTDPERIDAMLMKSVVSRHSAGFDVLPAPKSIVPLDRVQPIAVEALLEVARSEYDLVLLDMPPVWTSWSETALVNSDLLVLVTQVSVAGVRQARRQIAALSERKLGALPSLIVANRYQKRLFRRDIRLQEAERALGRRFDVCIPSDYRLVSEAVNAGVPLAVVKRRTRLEREIRKLMNVVQERLQESAVDAPAASRLAI
jgi:pilus assembly protein CpaE